MSCGNDPSIEQMQKDLLGGGWTKISSDTWMTLWGTYYRGPHRAWHVWAGVPMDGDEELVREALGGKS